MAERALELMCQRAASRVAFGKPLARTREYVEIVRAVLRREKKLEFHGEHFDVPLQGGTGLGKPLRTIVQPLRSDLPIYLAAIGPKNVALAAEIGDGWLPWLYWPEHADAIFGPSIAEGLQRSGRAREAFDVAPAVFVVVGDDIAMCRDLVRPMLALYIGGMGARGKNFYNDLVSRYGYEAEAAHIQNLYLDGNKGEAAMAVPDELIDAVCLVGPKEAITERLQAWKASGIDTLIAGAIQPEALQILAEAVL